MKKAISSLSLLLISILLSPFSKAQETHFTENKQQISVSVGYISVFDIFESITFGLISGLTQSEIDEMGSFATINLGYLYNLNKHWAVGAETTYQHFSAKFKDTSKDASTINHLTIMPAIRVYWFNKPTVAMYSKLCAGGSLVLSNSGDDSSVSGCFAAQLSPIAIEFGKNKIRGFVEAGLGMQGLANAGIRYSF